MNYQKSFVLTEITDILKEFREGVDFTVESKEKIIFHSEKLANCLMRKWGIESFFEAVKSLIPSPNFFSYEEKGRSAAFTFKTGKNKKHSDQEIPINQEVEKKLKDQRNKGISEEEFNKIDEQKKNEPIFKEISTQEALNDPWFNNQINNLFGLEKKNQPQKEISVKKDSNSNINYKNWTKGQLISEINKLKTEIESLKTNQSLTTSEKQTKLQQNQQKLAQLNNYYSNSVSQLNNSSDSKSKSNLPTNLAFGGTALALIGLVAVLVLRKTAKIKKRS